MPMTDSFSLERAREFQADPWAWTALHHFLPAGLLRELAVATVTTFAPGYVFEDLFEDQLSGDGILDSWAIVPKPVEAESLLFLQQHIRVLVWANDSEAYVSFRKDESDGQFARGLSHALQLGRFDFGAERQTLERLQIPESSGARCLVEAMLAATRNGWEEGIALSDVEAVLAGLQVPLQVLA